jgi:hypothetical protein
LESNQHLGKDKGLEQVSGVTDDELGRGDCLAQLCSGIAADMVVQVVVPRPQPIECRNGNYNSAAGFQERPSGPQKPLRVTEMLKDVQHQNGIIKLRWFEGRVQLPVVNALSPSSSFFHGSSIGFNPFNMPKASQCIKKQSRTTSDVEDSHWVARAFQERSDSPKQNTLADSPPPMPPV